MRRQWILYAQTANLGVERVHPPSPVKHREIGGHHSLSESAARFRGNGGAGIPDGPSVPTPPDGASANRLRPRWPASPQPGQAPSTTAPARVPPSWLLTAALHGP